ncbi:EAL domain-containing protein [Poseidonibacter antarcticus]|uniref:EAL domain-containing protein n=1 Tax=Poseidonibacter antarcticus TaxID=2478538 RepID=UPI000EF4A92D|nr:bifunctional diguanylate cyclase/phosphodiesterase [Poseidonibacter antarcticus]
MPLKKYIHNFFNKNKIKTLFLVDILYMKDINAIYNFKNGDYIIKQLKQILKNQIITLIKKEIGKKIIINLTNTHVDVFALTIYKDLSIDDILKIKNLIFEQVINHPFKLINKFSSINIDITIGCSKSSNQLIRVYAEKALHKAKLNFVHYMYYDAYLYENESISEDLVDILNYNIEHNLVEPYLQPIMDNTTNKIIKYEALMRLFDEKGNILMPQIFIHKSKKCRLYPKLMELLIDKIVLYIRKYKIHISINLDYTDILNPNIKKSLINKIQENDVGPYLTIEILESEKIANFTIVNNFISEVKKYDVKIAIDDFGTGFSNYEYILNLNVDYIKIDGSLIKKIDEEIYLNLIKSIVQFCKQQKIKVVAEFVSDLKILRYVKSIDIDYSQGYHIGKPATIKDIVGEKSEKRIKKDYRYNN